MPFVDEMPTRKLEVPDEEGVWFEVRELSWKELEECHREQQRKYMGRVKELGGDLLKAVAEMEATAITNPVVAAELEAAREPAANTNSADNLDPETLVTKSVVGWSYERRFQASLLAKLDEHTFNWLFESIVAIYARSEEGKASASATSIAT